MQRDSARMNSTSFIPSNTEHFTHCKTYTHPRQSLVAWRWLSPDWATGWAEPLQRRWPLTRGAGEPSWREQVETQVPQGSARCLKSLRLTCPQRMHVTPTNSLY